MTEQSEMQPPVPADAMRLFVAIQLPAEVKDALSEVQKELREVLPKKSASWTKPDAMHLTLRFLGNVKVSQLPDLTSRLRSALTGFGSFSLVCERLGCFPDLRFPRVVWAWAHDEKERLPLLHQAVDGAVSQFAEKPAEKRFVGHITLARPKQINKVDARRLADYVEAAVVRKFGAWDCGSVELIRSELSLAGSRYTTLETFNL